MALQTENIIFKLIWNPIAHTNTSEKAKGNSIFVAKPDAAGVLQLRGGGMAETNDLR